MAMSDDRARPLIDVPVSEYRSPGDPCFPLASTLPAAPASFAQVYPQVVWRERVPVTTVVWNLGGGNLAAAFSARELNHGCAIRHHGLTWWSQGHAENEG